MQVWRPEGLSEGDSIPVLVWIYGGKYVKGAASIPGLGGEREPASHV